MVIVIPTWCGRPEEGEAQLAQFSRIGTPIADMVKTTRYGASLAAFDKFLVNGQRNLMETCWLPALNSRAVNAIIRAAETAISPGCALITHEFRGAAARVPEDATAFGLRRDHVLVEIIAGFADIHDEFEEQRHRLWAWAARYGFDGFALPGGYPNILADNEDPQRIARSYGRNGERLIKPSAATIPTMSFAPPSRCRPQWRWPAPRDASELRASFG